MGWAITCRTTMSTPASQDPDPVPHSLGGRYPPAGRPGQLRVAGYFSDGSEPRAGPGDGTGDQPSQKTEAVIGPYELHDFYVYYTTRLGYAPPKVAFLAYCAWRDRTLGIGPTSRRPTGMRTALARLSTGCVYSPGVSSRSASLSGPVCPMPRRWAREARSPRAGITGPPATLRQPPGWSRCSAFQTTSNALPPCGRGF